MGVGPVSEVGELLARFRLSGATAKRPADLADAWLTNDRKVRTRGGDPAILAEMKKRRDEVAAELAAENDRRCTRCRRGGQLVSAYWDDTVRLCPRCCVNLCRQLDNEGWP